MLSLGKNTSLVSCSAMHQQNKNKFLIRIFLLLANIASPLSAHHSQQQGAAPGRRSSLPSELFLEISVGEPHPSGSSPVHVPVREVSVYFLAETSYACTLSKWHSSRAQGSPCSPLSPAPCGICSSLQQEAEKRQCCPFSSVPLGPACFIRATQ